MEIIGYLSSTLLAICGLPTAILSIKNGNSRHIDNGLCAIWYAAELLGIVYVTWLGNLPLIINYGFNVVFLTVICYYKLRPRN